MSAQIPCTAPLNIVQNLQTNKICKLKCAYQFTYPTTTLQIVNGGNHLLLTTDETANPPVNYNDLNYNVQYVGLVQPSVHQYNSSKADAELIIIHTTVSGNPLYVCIPIKNSSTSTSASVNFFDMIMSTVAQTASALGGRTIFTNSTFSLNRFVPMTPYFAYTGTNMFSAACRSKSSKIDYLVYHLDNAITMSPQAFATLKRVIPDRQTFNEAMSEDKNSGGLFYNPNGPTPANQPDIYIDCQPTGDDGEVLVAAKKDTSSFLDNKLIKDIMGSDILSSGIKLIIGLILMVLLWKVIMKVVQGIVSSAVSAKPLPVPKK
jgi:carbonic anhydrase